MWSALLIPPLSPTALFVRPLITDTRNPFLAEMTETAKQLCRPGYGILATDESIPTAGKRLETIGVENTVATRSMIKDIAEAESRRNLLILQVTSGSPGCPGQWCRQPSLGQPTECCC